MKTDIAFSADDSHRFLPWLIGVMVALAALLLCFALTINGWVVERNVSYGNNITVNIPASGDKNTPDEEAVQKIIEALRDVQGVASVTRLEQKQLQKILTPWLGGDMAESDLPLPAVLDVILKDGAKIDAQKLQAALLQFASGVEVDMHESWVAAFLSFSVAIRTLIMIFAALIAVAIGCMIAFTSRASLHLHKKAVNLLHAIGAEDGYIAAQFQKEAFLLTLRGAAAGCVAAAAAFFATGLYMQSQDNSSIPSLVMGSGHLLLLVLIAIICAATAWVTARFSVLHKLKQML